MYSKIPVGPILIALLVGMICCIIWIWKLHAMFTPPAPFPAALKNGNIAFYYHRAGELYDQEGTNSGTAYNTTLVDDQLGNPNNAFYFNGSNSFIKTIRPMQDLTYATFSFWFAAKLTSKYETLLSDADGDSNNCCKVALISYGSISGIYVVANKNGAQNGVMITNGFYEFKDKIDRKWVNLVWVMSPTNQRVYINGVEVDNVFVTANDVGSHGNGLIIGADDSSFPYRDYFSGAIDNIRIYNRALSKDEVRLLYNAMNP